MVNLSKLHDSISRTSDEPLWLDAPDAAQRASVAKVSDEAKQVATDLITKGIGILRGVQDPTICQQVIADYQTFCGQSPDLHASSLDEAGREKRLVNFHNYSDAAMQIGTNPRLMSILDFLFGAEACVYTSLTFKYSTQQPVHRDIPHFATWPRNYFVGVWTALEDIDPESGPLFYYEGGHRFEVDEAEIWQRVQRDRPDLSHKDALELALDLYNGQVIDTAPHNGEHRIVEMKRGDVVIWHPQLPHGGSPAIDPSKSRWSTVFHCAPVRKQVHQHDAFFEHAGREEPPSRYAYKNAYNRKVAVAGDVAFQ